MLVDIKKLDRALNPRTVAVVGDKQTSGYNWLHNMSTVRGKLYSVQIDEKDIPGIEAMGVPNYKSLVEIPDEIDFVLVAVPRQAAPAILKDCIAKKVGGVAFFSSGFAETNSDEGKRLQAIMKQMAREAGIVMLGPNCMGLYNPAAGVRFGEGQPVGFDGPVSFVSQSGGHGGSFAMAAYAAGIPVGKVVSFGNGIVLENADYLEYFAQDPNTRFIGMYIEGLQDGRRFFRLLQETTPHKPVVLWKGGLSEAGRRAAASHTASLAGDAILWDTLCRQCGAISVNSLEEMVDALKAVTLLPPFTGDRLGITGGSGGQSVSMSDAFSHEGLRVPLLTATSYQRLESFFRLIGSSYRNPIDMGGFNRREIATVLDVLINDGNVDCGVLQLRTGGDRAEERQAEAQIRVFVEHKQRTTKPLAAILFSPTPLKHAEVLQAMEQPLRAAGIPTFSSYEGAAKALRRVMDYYRFHQSVD